jgi:hypothetical protein
MLRLLKHAILQWTNPLRNLFYKDTHVVVKAGPGMTVDHKLMLSTVIAINKVDTYTINKKTQPWPSKTGSFSVISLRTITNPISMAFWALFYQQMGATDVAGIVECHGVKPDVYFGLNNPTILKPYVTIWSGDGSIAYQHRLAEGESYMFTDRSGHNVLIERMNDSDCKEFVVTIDP